MEACSYQHTHGVLLPLARRWPDTPPSLSAEKVRRLVELMRQGVCLPPVGVIFGRDASGAAFAFATTLGRARLEFMRRA